MKRKKSVTYCPACGSKTEAKHMGRFNSETGNRVLEPACVNPACYGGCLNSGGHTFRKGLSAMFGPNPCTRCGFDIDRM